MNFCEFMLNLTVVKINFSVSHLFAGEYRYEILKITLQNIFIDENSCWLWLFYMQLYSQFTSVSPATSLGGSRHSSMALAAAAFAQFTSREMCTLASCNSWLDSIRLRVFVYLSISVEFFDGDRSHMKQELLEPEDEFSSIQTTNFIKIPTTILKAWQVGHKCSASNFQGRISDIFVVGSEPKFWHSSTGCHPELWLHC